MVQCAEKYFRRWQSVRGAGRCDEHWLDAIAIWEKALQSLDLRKVVDDYIGIGRVPRDDPEPLKQRMSRYTDAGIARRADPPTNPATAQSRMTSQLILLCHKRNRVAGGRGGD